jgi:alkylation response protein AidB-like acyl-CoA dehydrogenase
MSTGPQAFCTQAVKESGVFYITGEKHYVINGPIADWTAVAARLEGGTDTVLFFINRENRGLTAGPKLATLGYRGTPMGTITLKDCPVPGDLVLGPCTGNGSLSMLRLWEGQILTAAALGQMKRVFDMASSWAKSHMSGGKPIIAYQEVAFKLAEMMTLFQTAQFLAYRAAWMDDTDHKEKGVLAHCAKVFCTESAETLASQALQILGAKGCLEGNPAETGYRDAKYLQIAGISSEIARMRIADALL